MFRGLGVFLPPLLTVVIFLWVGSTIEQYILEPVTAGTRNGLVWAISDIRYEKDLPAGEEGKENPTVEGVVYQRVGNRSYVPKGVYDLVVEDLGPGNVPRTGAGVYRRYVELRYLRPYLVIPFFLCLFLLLLYLAGKFMAAGIGRMFWNLFEGLIRRVPLVREVYSSVKQVSDFLLSEREIRASRVVAVEWPRRGVWALGLVTGESMRDIEAAANESVISVLICTSPAPMTGFTVTVRRSETIDLNISIDQAFQYVISCGVVVPPSQVRKLQAPVEPAGPLPGEAPEAPTVNQSQEPVAK